MTMPNGWLRVYRCGCDSFAFIEEELPERCPGHDKGAIFDQHGSPNIPIDFPIVNNSPHTCGAKPCPEGVRS
jgi:hypothetical protein